MLIPTDQLSVPEFTSILLVGPPKTGKTTSLKTLHNVLVQRKLPTKMVFFDLDDDGAEPFLRAARAGGWSGDIELHRFNEGPRAIKNAIRPTRKQDPAIDFVNEFNTLFDRIDSRTKGWKPGEEIGAVIIDSCTGLQDKFEDWIFGSRNREIGEEGNNAITFNDWRLLQEKIMDAYTSGKSLPCYFVLTAHVEARQEVIKGPPVGPGQASRDIATSKYYQLPLVTGVLRERIAKDFGVVLYTNEDFKWVTRPSDHIRSAGSRGKDNLPPIIEQDFSKVLDI